MACKYNHLPSARNLQSVLVFFQHPVWFSELVITNHINVWYFAELYYSCFNQFLQRIWHPKDFFTVFKNNSRNDYT